MKKFFITITILIVFLLITGLIERNYCHYLTTTPPPGASTDYIKTNIFCRLNSLPGVVGSVLIIETVKYIFKPAL